MYSSKLAACFCEIDGGSSGLLENERSNNKKE